MQSTNLFPDGDDARVRSFLRFPRRISVAPGESSLLDRLLVEHALRLVRGGVTNITAPLPPKDE
ncbi:MAG: hypothetical protein V4684_07555 [Pseudomonadota bacterium]